MNQPTLHVVPAPNEAATCTPLEQLRSTLQSRLIERDDAIDAIIRARVAGHHVVFLGPPGEAKSLLATTFAACVAESYWGTLLTKFSTPNDLFGMMKLSSFQQDRYEFHTTGYFQAAQIVFLDETFKGNPGVLNALLTALNERKWMNDGKECKLPLRMCIGASNEYIEGPELGAIWDRFLVRVWVAPVEDRDNFIKMLEVGDNPPPAATAIPGLDMANEAALAKVVTIPLAVRQALADVRESLKKAGHKASGRRWIQVQSLAKAEAHLDGRTAARPGDLSCLGDALWNEEPERHEIVRIIQKTVDPTAAKATARLDDARTAFKALPKDVAAAGGLDGFLGASARTVATLKGILKDLDGLGGGRAVDKARTEVAQILDAVGAAGLNAYGGGA